MENSKIKFEPFGKLAQESFPEWRYYYVWVGGILTGIVRRDPDGVWRISTRYGVAVTDYMTTNQYRTRREAAEAIVGSGQYAA